MHAVYFDGRSAAAHAVTIDIANERLQVTGDGIAFDLPLGAVEVTDRLGNTPRQLRLPDGGFCEVADVDALDRALAAAGVRSSAVSGWERSGRLALMSVIVLAIAGFLAYRYGVPMLADSVARNLPPVAVTAISDNAVKVLDTLVFDPSEVPMHRQSEIRFGFARLRLSGLRDGPRLEQIEFRKSDLIGPNALALPSGRIIVTDALVALAKDDRELFGVLAHEVGHVGQRHGLRNLLQSSIVALLVTWYIGDVGTVAAAAPTALLNAKYSRDFERAADAYAIETMELNGIPLSHLADILERMERDRGGAGSASDYLSSHPATAERLKVLRGRKKAHATPLIYLRRRTAVPSRSDA